MAKRRALEIIEGYYLALIINHLHRCGMLERLKNGEFVSRLAGAFGYDERLLTALLDFIYQTSDVLTRGRAGKYALNRKYHAYYFLGFQFDKFVGAYGPALARLDQSLRSESLGRQLVNREIEAEAYRTVGAPPNPVVIEIVRDRRISSLLDLGCGTATLLTELCLADPNFRGWGIDETEAMCKVARERIADLHLNGRIQIIRADARTLDTCLRPVIRRRIEALQSKGLFNELFRYGEQEAIDYLRKLKKLFPGRLLFVVDYYGKLTQVSHTNLKYRHTLIHDVIQVITAQGVPPPDVAGWARVYHGAGCSIEHTYEGDSQGIEWFVHLVRL